MQMNYPLPDTGFLRLPHILGQTAVTEEQASHNRKTGKGPRRARPAIPAIFPVKKTCWWEGIRSGRFPKPVKLGHGRAAFWRVEDIRALIEKA
jgi:prophage regulatory protein